MHGAIVMEYISRRMAELGYGNQYDLRMRHFVIPPLGNAYTYLTDHVMVLIEPVEMVRVSSEAGYFDLGGADNNELQYEHRGYVLIENYAGNNTVHVRFMQAIARAK